MNIMYVMIDMIMIGLRLVNLSYKSCSVYNSDYRVDIFIVLVHEDIYKI